MNELSDQNEILVQTVEELEREANDRVALVESKLQKAAQSLKVMDLFYLAIYQLMVKYWCYYQTSLSQTHGNECNLTLSR